MAAKALVQIAEEQVYSGPWAQPRRERPAPGLATGSEAPAASPALMLQQALSAELGRGEETKWSPAATLGFIVATCGTFWAVVGFGVAAIVGTH